MPGGRFDELARALATPMPRRRALRIVGLALLGASVPAVASRAARAAVAGGCAFICGDDKSFDCCSGDDTCCWPPGLNPVCCPTGNVCDQNAGCVAPCADGRPRCGVTCCSAGKSCTDPSRSLCCDDGSTLCDGKCCPKGFECATLVVAGKRNELCVPRCPSGQTRCGVACCPRGTRCSNPNTATCGKCPPGQRGCGKRCCPSGSTCCDASKGLCCKARTETCGGFGTTPICCPKGRDACESSPGSRKPRCCPKGEKCASVGDESGTIPPSRQGQKTCCPPERFVPNAGGVCCPPGYTSLGGKLVVPPGGGGGLCCRNDKLCGSAGNPSCCGTSTFAPELDQICCGGTCVSPTIDPANCGGCGVVCPSGQCSAGVCVP